MPTQKIHKGYFFLIGFIVILTIVSYTLNIKEPVLIPDEGIRALVAFEMHQTGDYISPKMGELFYYKKPPVYNWLVATYYELSGEYSEMGTRVPMLLSLFIFALSIFYVAKRHFDIKTGFIAALFFIVSLRILSYETLYGLIDISYSLIVFYTIIISWKKSQEKKYLSLFVITYSLTALSFLMKGIPSIAYQGLTLLLVFTMNKEFKKLFSWQHILGGMSFLTIVGLYYLSYYLKNPDHLEKLFSTLFFESADKSGIAFSIWEVMLHAFSFPIEIMYSFIPSSIIVVFLFNSKSRQYLKSEPFLLFLILAFLINLSIYLISPISYMRYVIPHFALLSIPSAAAYTQLQNRGDSKMLRIIDGFFLITVLLILIGNFAYPFVPQLSFIDHIWIKSISMLLILLIPSIFLFKNRKYRAELFIIALLVFKLGYNWFIIPSRNQNNFVSEMREKCLYHGNQMKGETAILYNSSIGRVEHFYLSAGKKAVIPATQDTTNATYIIGYNIPIDLSAYRLVDEFQIEYYKVPMKIYKRK